MNRVRGGTVAIVSPLEYLGRALHLVAQHKYAHERDSSQLFRSVRKLEELAVRVIRRQLRRLRRSCQQPGCRGGDVRGNEPGGVGMPCAGQPYASEMCCVFEVRDGLVVREHDYIDRSPTSA